MKIKHTLTAAVAAVIMTGAAASAAQATSYDLTGGNYSGGSGQGLIFSLDGGASVTCDGLTLTGNTENVPGDSAATAITPSFGACWEHSAQPLVAQAPNAWKLTVAGPKDGLGRFNAVISTPGRTLVEFVDPVAVYFPELAEYVCKYTFKTPVGGAPVKVRQGGSGVFLNADTAGLAYEGTNCPTPGPANDRSLSAGEVFIPGITINEL
jgi:hypothetical protein